MSPVADLARAATAIRLGKDLRTSAESAALGPNDRRPVRYPIHMTQCWWLYLLECHDGRTYAGIATDVAARFEAHARGKGAKFTRSNRPVRVLGAQVYSSKSEALKAEAALKKLDRAEKLAWARTCVSI
jgi:putative endonuclease